MAETRSDTAFSIYEARIVALIATGEGDPNLDTLPYNGGVMLRELDAVYENGVLRPLEPLPFSEAQRVRITVSDLDAAQCLVDRAVLAEAHAEVSKMQHKPTIDEVRAALSSIKGNMPDVVIEERGEY